MKLRSFSAALLALFAMSSTARAQIFSNTTIAADATLIWRDWCTNGVSTSCGGVPYNPVKSDIRRWGATVGGAITQLLGTAGAGSLGYLTRAALYADLAHPANSLATVWSDATTAFDGMYIKVGASGGGSWSQVSASLFGLQPSWAIGTLTTLNAGSAPTVAVGGPVTAPTLSFGLPTTPIFSIGTVTSAPSTDPAAVTVSGTVNNPVLNFSIPRGVAGAGNFVWRGAWSLGATYAINDVVKSGGLSYIATAAGVGHIPPNASYWDVMVDAGQFAGTAYSGVTTPAYSAGPITGQGLVNQSFSISTNPATEIGSQSLTVNADYSSAANGTLGFPSAAVDFHATTKASQNTFVWTLLSTIDNYSTTAAENSAFYAICNNYGKICIAALSDSEDLSGTGNPAFSKVAHEIDQRGVGADSSANRIGIDFQSQRYFAGTTGASGTGATATVTFARSVTWPVASDIVIAGMTPAGYNGVHTVTASGPGTVSFASATTGGQTVGGTVTANSVFTAGKAMRVVSSGGNSRWRTALSVEGLMVGPIFDTSLATAGIDTLRMTSTQRINFTTDIDRTLEHNTALLYKVGVTNMFTVSDTGLVGAALGFAVGVNVGLSLNCTVMPTGVVWSGGIVIARTGGTCT